MHNKPVEILMVDDSECDVGLVQIALRSTRVPTQLHVVGDGAEAMAYLRRLNATRPDLILLDLNMPRKTGREVLAEIRADQELKDIPIVVFTTSDSDQDAQDCYSLQCNCFITKPITLNDFIEVLNNVCDFWSDTAELPLHSTVSKENG